jgi:hypothetical protein
MIDLTICRCPHCAEQGIGLLDKILATPPYPATCALCRRCSTTTVLGISALFVAVAPQVFDPVTHERAAIAAALFVIAVKAIGPLSRYDL